MSKKRVIIVTGGGTGIGKAIVELFTKSGDIVYAMGRRVAPLEAIAKSYKNKEVVARSVDVTKPSSVEAVVNEVIKAHKTIDVLINCAGGSGHIDQNSSLSEAVTVWQSIIDVNLTGTFVMIQATKKHLARPGGRIISISSVAALNGSSQPGGEAYAAAKAGLHGMSRTLVKELSKDGITVNCVAPGFVKDTEFFSLSVPMVERIKNNVAVIPLGRVAVPSDIASAVFYLASPEASFVNGEILNVNGGVAFGR